MTDLDGEKQNINFTQKSLPPKRESHYISCEIMQLHRLDFILWSSFDRKHIRVILANDVHISKSQFPPGKVIVCA